MEKYTEKKKSPELVKSERLHCTLEKEYAEMSCHETVDANQ